jgi:hypothetical protein
MRGIYLFDTLAIAPPDPHGLTMFVGGPDNELGTGGRGLENKGENKRAKPSRMQS